MRQCKEGECQGCQAGTPHCEPCPDPCSCHPGDCIDCIAGTSGSVSQLLPFLSAKRTRCHASNHGMAGQQVTGGVMGDAACEECEDVCDCLVGSCIGCVADQPQCQPCEDRCDCDPSQCLVAPVLGLASFSCPAGHRLRAQRMGVRTQGCISLTGLDAGLQGCDAGKAVCDPCGDKCFCVPGTCQAWTRPPPSTIRSVVQLLVAVGCFRR